MGFNQIISSTFIAVLLMLSLAATEFSSFPAASATFPGSNGRIAFQSNRDGNFEIYVMNADGSGQTRLTNNPASDSLPDWSPDNSKIAFVSDRDGNEEIYVMNADGSGQTRLTNNPASDSYPNWSPDGTKILFESNSTGQTGVYVMNNDGSGQKQLIEDGRQASWSPDGKKIVFISGPWGNGTSTIHIMNADGSSLVRLAYDPQSLQFPDPDPPNNPTTRGFEHWPDWSPDGTKITFTGQEVGPSIYSINVDGTDFLRLDGQWDLYSTWSPDGTKAVFTKSYSGPNLSDYEIYTINADGNRQTLTKLTSNNAQDDSPDWGSAPNIPDSSKHELTVTTVDRNGNPLSGIWTTIRTTNGTLVKSGFTPLTYVGNPGLYKITVANYDGKTFVYWENGGGIYRGRIISLSSDIGLAAVYNVSSYIRGFTPLSYTHVPTYYSVGNITVNALGIDGNKTLHMWTIIDTEGETKYETTYKVYATNGYQNLIFDHWEDGTTNRIRTITVEQPTTITAYYRTG